MGLLRLAVLGPPEVFHDGSRLTFSLRKALSLARASKDQELEARSLSLLGWIHIRAGDFQEAMHALEASLAPSRSLRKSFHCPPLPLALHPPNH